MKFTKLFAAAGVLSFVASAAAFAQTATQIVTFQVNAINQISVAGAPSLTINTAVAGSAPTSVTDNVSTWAVTTNQSTAKITGSLSAAMPAGLTLSANLAAPAGASSAGLTALSAGAVDLVTGITKLNASGLGLTYQLDATAAAGVVASSTRTVTYTITGGV
ncbi:MAG TPA: hypothetical protein VN651_01185 [Gemmatimonadaceae bacterium]|nr:hypothetical protein [Gemmatimonadaceae bacterium]